MKLLLALTLVCLAVAKPSEKAEPQGAKQEVKKIPLRKVESLREKLTKSGDWFHFEHYMNKQKVAKSFNQKVDEKAINTAYYADAQYVFDITVGTPGQQFSVLLSTEVPWLWIPDHSCKGGDEDCPGYCHDYMCGYMTCEKSACAGECSIFYPQNYASYSNGCSNKRTFNPSMSSSFNSIRGNSARFDIQSGNYGTIQGYFGYDTVNLFGYEASQYVQLVDQLGYFWQHIQADGLLGFGPPKVEPRTGMVVKPFFMNAYNQGRLYQNLFSISIGTHQAELTIGVTDPYVYTGAIQTHPASGAWQILVSSVHILPYPGHFNSYARENTFAGISGSAMLSASANYVGLPQAVIQNILSFAGASYYQSSMNMYRVPCSIEADLSFNVGSHAYTMRMNDLIMQSYGSCYLNVKQTDYGFILGTPFLQHYYSVYEYQGASQMIGLAQSRF